MNLKETYDAIIALQKDLSKVLQDKPLSTGMYYREVQALAAAYELQDYLANRLGKDGEPLSCTEEATELIGTLL